MVHVVVECPLRDYSFKTLAFFRGKGSKICQICQWIVAKKCQWIGVGIKNCEKLAYFLNGWSLICRKKLSHKYLSQLESLNYFIFVALKSPIKHNTDKSWITNISFTWLKMWNKILGNNQHFFFFESRIDHATVS